MHPVCPAEVYFKSSLELLWGYIENDAKRSL